MTRKIKCERCGRWNELTMEQMEEFGSMFSLQKCPQCKDIKLEREYFVPIERGVIENYKKAYKSRYGPVFKLYLFGSYARNELKCGDIDFLLAWDQSELDKIIQEERETLFDDFNMFFIENCPEIFESQRRCFTSEKSLLVLKKFLENNFWDFRTCQEYPDCLNCYRENGNKYCKLPEEDWHADLHTYCLIGCRNRKRKPFPTCSFGDNCVFLHSEMDDRITEEFVKILKEGVIEFHEITPDYKIKILEFTGKPSLFELKQQFEKSNDQREFIVYRIDPINGEKIEVTEREMVQDHTQKMIQKSLERCQQAIKEKNLSDAVKEIGVIQNYLQKDIENCAKEGIVINEKTIKYYKDVLEKLGNFITKPDSGKSE